MSGARFFLDTNVLVYTFANEAPEKQRTARQLVEEGLSGGGCISFQVVQEFLNVATRKFVPVMSASAAQRYLRAVLSPLCSVFPSVALVELAIDVHVRWRFSFYDSMILAAAMEARCDRVLSEDLQHAQKVGDLEIVNPFLRSY